MALKKQLAVIEGLRGKNYREAEIAEQEWMNFTLNILHHGFGEDSENVSQFHHAKWAGEHRMGGMSVGQIQRNFDGRIEAFAALLRSSMAELELFMPEPEITGAYQPVNDYQFYRDLKTIVSFGTKDIFLVDGYLDMQLFDVYMDGVNASVLVRVLTNQVGEPLRVVAEKSRSAATLNSAPVKTFTTGWYLRMTGAGLSANPSKMPLRRSRLTSLSTPV